MARGLKEVVIPHTKIRDPQTITQVQTDAMARQGLDIHRDEVTEITDDHDHGTRRLKVRAPTKYFFQR